MLRLSVIRSIIVFSLTCCCLVVSHSYVLKTMPETHPDHPGKCWWSETSTAYGIGETFNIQNSCAKAVCNSDFSVSITGCSLRVISDKTCRKVEPDLRLPFPKCCSEYECTDAEGNKRRV